eukprot:10529890-Alexandrium_andersonii.AAC.1
MEQQWPRMCKPANGRKHPGVPNFSPRSTNHPWPRIHLEPPDTASDGLKPRSLAVCSSSLSYPASTPLYVLLGARYAPLERRLALLAQLAPAQRFRSLGNKST